MSCLCPEYCKSENPDYCRDTRKILEEIQAIKITREDRERAEDFARKALGLKPEDRYLEFNI